MNCKKFQEKTPITEQKNKCIVKLFGHVDFQSV